MPVRGRSLALDTVLFGAPSLRACGTEAVNGAEKGMDDSTGIVFAMDTKGGVHETITVKVTSSYSLAEAVVVFWVVVETVPALLDGLSAIGSELRQQTHRQSQRDKKEKGSSRH